jgi:hypothetical protein
MEGMSPDLKANTTSRDETGGIIQQLEDDSTRQDAMEVRYDMQLESWQDILVKRINERLSDDSKTKMETYIRTRFCPFKSINEEVADLYTDDPTREFEGPSMEFFQETYERIDIDTLMELANIFLNAVNEVLLYVKRVDDNQIDVDFLPPHVVTVLCDSDNPTIPVAVYIKRRWDASEDYTPSNRYWMVWTNSLHYILNGNGSRSPIEGNEGMLNPWGELPFVFLHRKRPIDGFWNNSTGNSLFEFTISYGICDVMNNFTKFWSGFKQVAAFGDRVVIPSGMLLSPDVAMTVEGDSVSVTTLDFQINLDQLSKDMQTQIAAISQEYGIDMGNYSMSEKESGRAIYIRNTKLQKIRKKQEKVLRAGEIRLFELTKGINAILNGKQPESDTTEMNLNYAEMKAYVEPKEELDIQAQEIELDLADKVEVFMERNPGFKDYNEAKKRLIEIHKSNNEFEQIPDASITEELNREGEKENEENTEDTQ